MNYDRYINDLFDTMIEDVKTIQRATYLVSRGE